MPLVLRPRPDLCRAALLELAAHLLVLDLQVVVLGAQLVQLRLQRARLSAPLLDALADRREARLEGEDRLD